MTQAAVQQQQVETQEPQEAPLAPVDVNVESGAVTEAPVPPPPEQQRPRPKPRHEVRIQTLASERDEARTFAARLQQELEQSRREAAQNKAEKEAAERTGMTNYAARVDSDVEKAEMALRAAKEAKDDDAEVKAQIALAKAVADARDVDAWRATQPKEGEQPRHQQPQEQRQAPQQQQAPQYVPPPEPVRNFMVENSWFSAVKLDDAGNPVKQNGQFIENPDFDVDMHDEAMSEHRRVQREIKLGKLSEDYLQTPEYFQRIRARVEKEFADAFEGEEETPPAQRPRTPPMAPSRQPVAPAQRQSQPGTPPKNGTKMRLDGEQADFVRRLVDNGTMIHPRNHPDAAKRGQKMTYDEAYVQYAKNLQSDPGNQQNRQ